jgi:hypothetical protein
MIPRDPARPQRAVGRPAEQVDVVLARQVPACHPEHDKPTGHQPGEHDVHERHHRPALEEDRPDVGRLGAARGGGDPVPDRVLHP